MKKMANITGLPGGDLSNIWGYTAPNGKEYAIVGSKSATNFYDVTNCASPILKASIVDGLVTSWREYKSYKNFVYSVSEAGNVTSGGLKMFNLTDPNNITFFQDNSPTDTFFLNAHTLSIDTVNARLYVSGAAGSSNSLLYIYQLSQTNIVPTLLKKIQLNNLIGVPYSLYIHDLYVENNIVYASHGYRGFYVWDCTDPQNIILLGSHDDPNNGNDGYNHSSWRHPNFPEYFYCAEEIPSGQPMIIYNITYPNSTTANITAVKTFKDPLGAPTFTNNIYHNPHAKGNELYIATYNDGIQVYDISSPLKPIRAAYYDTYPQRPTASLGYNGYNGAWGVYPFLNSGCILASDINNGFFTLKKHFPKVEVQGNLLVAEAGKGIIFRDSSTTASYKILKVSDAGELSVSPITGFQSEHRIDSADVEVINVTNKIYLISPGNNTYELNIDNNGLITTSLVPGTVINALKIQGHLVIDNKHKGVIIKSPNAQRWKLSASLATGQLAINKTAF